MPHTIKESTEAKTKSTPKQKEELQTQLKAEAAGLDAKSFKRIQDLIQKRYQEDIAAAMKRAEAEQKALQSKEWKEAAKEIRKEVEADIKQRPDVAAGLLIGSGELGGKQLERKNYPLRAEDLTAEQKASLPRRYYSKDGVPVDMMANLFGFTSGDRLVEELSSYTKSREGMSAQEGLRKTIDEEVQRRMEEKFGKLQDNIMLEAMDQARSAYEHLTIHALLCITTDAPTSQIGQYRHFGHRRVDHICPAQYANQHHFSGIYQSIEYPLVSLKELFCVRNYYLL